MDRHRFHRWHKAKRLNGIHVMPLVAYALSRSEATVYSRIQMDHGCGRLTIATGQSCDQEAILSSRLSVFKTPSSGTDGG